MTGYYDTVRYLQFMSAVDIEDASVVLLGGVYSHLEGLSTPSTNGTWKMNLPENVMCQHSTLEILASELTH